MREIIPNSLFSLAQNAPKPLYVVGGSVRDYLAQLSSSAARDWDICAPMPPETLAELANELGFTVKAVYKNTGTVKLQDRENREYEYTSFRSDKYVRGVHAPSEIYFTDDIELDARRRDFTCNAVYYDVKNATFIDPLNGISAIREKRLTTVAISEKVFGEDGLRLMRLARQAAQLGFTPDEECLRGAQKNAALIQDITPERIYAELCAILRADEKYGVQEGHYHGLALLEKTGVLAYILPELALGKHMAQRADFHDHDVLEHSFRAALYAPARVRLAALLHDVGKPYCTLRDGNSHDHPIEGKTLTTRILQRLKAPKKTIEQVGALVEWHMYDFNCQTSENKLRRFFVRNYAILEDLLALKQADFSACKDDLSTAPTCARWQALLQKMKAQNVPFSLKELAVNGNDLLALGVTPSHISGVLHALLLHTAVLPQDNEKKRLCKLAKGFENTL